jgi:hypothetical protein
MTPTHTSTHATNKYINTLTSTYTNTCHHLPTPTHATNYLHQHHATIYLHQHMPPTNNTCFLLSFPKGTKESYLCPIRKVLKRPIYTKATSVSCTNVSSVPTLRVCLKLTLLKRVRLRMSALQVANEDSGSHTFSKVLCIVSVITLCRVPCFQLLCYRENNEGTDWPDF